MQECQSLIMNRRLFDLEELQESHIENLDILHDNAMSMKDARVHYTFLHLLTQEINKQKRLIAGHKEDMAQEVISEEKVAEYRRKFYAKN